VCHNKGRKIRARDTKAMCPLTSFVKFAHKIEKVPMGDKMPDNMYLLILWVVKSGSQVSGGEQLSLANFVGVLHMDPLTCKIE
jgi:hypothetical protein